MRERIAWTMWLATSRERPDVDHVAARWRQAAAELAASASRLATADRVPGLSARGRGWRQPGRLVLKARPRSPASG